MNIQLWERCSNCGAFVWVSDMCGDVCSTCYIEREYNKLTEADLDVSTIV